VSRLAILLLALMAGPAFAGTDVFQKWRTPEGTLYIGDRPPAGSVLLETIELTASEGSAVANAADSTSVVGDAAAHGREIMRLRAAEREAARNRELERSLREPVVPIVDPVPPVVFIGGGGHHHHRRHGHHRPRLGVGPSPISVAERPNITLVTPDESARRYHSPPGFARPPEGGAPLFPVAAPPRWRDR
jgi:hypothetical protein